MCVAADVGVLVWTIQNIWFMCAYITYIHNVAIKNFTS